jgi:phosphoribosylformimino-5-aminoimidazole carboxamide ribotide isomerase
MIVIPAVELREGACVQPLDDPGAAREARRHPAPDAPRGWSQLGFRRLHVFDLDAAAGIGTNDFLLDDILREISVDVQVGGGVNTGDRLDQLLTAGASQVIVGPRGLEEPEWLAGAAADHPGVLIVATDVRERRVTTRGRVRTLVIDILDLVDELAEIPLAGLLVSAAHFEGLFASELALLEDLAETAAFPIMTAGGVTSVADLLALSHRGVSAAVIGQPLYTGALDPRAIAQEFGE